MADTEKALVVIHTDEDGMPHFYANGDVDLLTVCDGVEERFYMMSPSPVPEHILEEMNEADIGHKDDGSPANARAYSAVAEITGHSHLTVIE